MTYYHIRKNGQDRISFLNAPPTRGEILAFEFHPEVVHLAKEKLPEAYENYINCKISPHALADKVAKLFSKEDFEKLLKNNNLTITEETEP